uniref:Radical SAM core domain-containing protein n=1 Tax=Panagrellus redivivus TaxID=6233 RepID=A0A7E4VMR7_PANRE
MMICSKVWSLCTIRPLSCIKQSPCSASPIEETVVKPTPILLNPDPNAAVGKTPLTDRFNRFHSYLRISLTEKCNLRCSYCMPLEGVPLSPANHILTAAEIGRLTSVFAQNGVDKVRLTGGEPTMRKDLVDIISQIGSVPGIVQIGMTSNGVALSGKLEKLRNSGLSKLNISIDTLHEAKFDILARRPGFKQVWKTIDRAEDMFDRLKLNCVVMRQVNLDEVTDFVELTRNRNLDIRFIEFMPFGGNNYSMNKFVPYKEMLGLIIERFGDIEKLQDHPNDTSKAYKVNGFEGQFGFITSMSEHFCATCNRVRVTADGNLKVCLHGEAEVSLRDAMRSGIDDKGLENIIAQAVYKKKARHAGIKNLVNLTNRPMILIAHLKPNVNRSYTSYRSFSTKMTHVDSSGKASMVDISSKSNSQRIALAKAVIQVSPNILKALIENNLKKGDAFATARIAAIISAKKTCDLIPLCHQIPLSDIQVKFFQNEQNSTVTIYCRASTVWSTGVEMEALTACSVGALVLFDMCKALGSTEMQIGPINLLGKRGGKADFGVVSFDELDVDLASLK